MTTDPQVILVLGDQVEEIVPPLPRQPVTGSTNVASIGYDAARLLLDVEFANASVYRYFKVPQGLHADLMAAESIGQFLNQRIVRGGFRHLLLLGAVKQQPDPRAILEATIGSLVASMDAHGSTLYRTDLTLPDGRFASIVIGLGDVGAFVAQNARVWAMGTEKAYYPAGGDKPAS